MNENSMKLSFSSVSQNEAFARSVVAAFATQLNPTIEELSDVRTAVSEAVTNAIIHGYGNDPLRQVHMECSIHGSDLEIIVRDVGRGIEDVALAMQPFYTTAPSLERSGMGFAVMEAFMDSVSVHSEVGQGTSVVMKKKISSAVRTDA